MIRANVKIDRPTPGQNADLGSHYFAALPQVNDTIDLGDTIGEVSVKSILHSPIATLSLIHIQPIEVTLFVGV